MSSHTHPHPHPQPEGGAPRFNMYQAIHKALRAFMADTLTRVGRTDHGDAQECEETAAQLRALLHLCGEHLTHENTFVHAAMERRAPGSAARIADEHVAHLAHIAALSSALDGALRAPAAAGAAAWQRLYQALSLFVAENFEHMLVEERDHNAVLWAHYSDAELHAIHDALVASIPPDEMAFTFKWMLPQLAHAERAAMMGGMRMGMPPEVFAGQLAAARTLLDERAWRKLEAALGAAPARPEALA